VYTTHAGYSHAATVSEKRRFTNRTVGAPSRFDGECARPAKPIAALVLESRRAHSLRPRNSDGELADAKGILIIGIERFWNVF
jgi:hypothetical protein